jgi:TATA-box binding protein (TBP) (component of TFIID and TFIIIB)
VRKDQRPPFRLIMNNVLGNAQLGCSIDTEKIMRLFGGFRTSRFPAVVSSFAEMNTTLLFYQSGQVVCTAAASYFHCLASVNLMALILSRINGSNIRMRNFCVRNMAGHFFTGRMIDMDKLFAKMSVVSDVSVGCERPDRFKGCPVVLAKLNRISMIPFNTGRMVAVGMKNEEECEAAENESGFVREFHYGPMMTDEKFDDKAYKYIDGDFAIEKICEDMAAENPDCKAVDSTGTFADLPLKEPEPAIVYHSKRKKMNNTKVPGVLPLKRDNIRARKTAKKKSTLYSAKKSQKRATKHK